ncbi:glycosyltransferase family 2 protein [Dysgonomonas sp. Marseille-P4677]|uniref:glycosyltransferase family 2 protein n=1 Tax=Dysgonomonas sp. Marseille-P4677 TaxID=2364790 RepID=UPI001913D0C7|nr:glycosyltransferase family 2 protein [Dysgonomonas sp. Marseille-P4677]MBK5721491.1 glycosyltransferase family 2 protein [Dysgonomonas sp. Marseille-P4677]
MASKSIYNRKPTLTIFTPAYNRAHTIELCYESLLRQTSTDFKWLIVDDGSTDSTGNLVTGWIAERKIPIEYHYQNNQGMHGAHNTAYNLIDTELNVCIDSDDYLADNSVELIINKWRKEGSDKYAGIMGLDAKFDGTIIGTEFTTPQTTLSDFYMRGGRGDKKLIYRTSIIKSVPEYPIFEGEKYVGLGYKYQLIDLKYELLTMNEVLCYVDYQIDGSSMNMYRQYFKNPRGFAFIRKESMKNHPSGKRRFIEAMHYISSSIICRNCRFVSESPRKFMTVLAIPFGVVLYLYLLFQYKCNKIMSLE